MLSFKQAITATSAPQVMPNAPRIFLVLSMANSMGRSLFRGILDFSHREREKGWRFHASLNQLTLEWDDLMKVRRPAVILQAHDPELLKRLDAEGIPRVNVSGFLEDKRGPQIVPDNLKIGAMAADHFLERGFNQFAFLGVANSLYSEQRCKGFCDQLTATGWKGSVSSRSIAASSTYLDRPLQQEVEDWLGGLPRPAALFTATDGLARLALEVCERMNIHCPSDLAVLGSDNDDLEGAVSPVPISSVVVPFRTIGYRAAQQLDQLLQGETPLKSHTFIPPAGIITRRSTEALAIDDPVIEKAVRIIRERLHEPPSVEELARASGVSRRYLERHFRSALGRSPLEELLRYRLSQVQLLLAETNLTISEIAHRCGFDEAKALHRSFRSAFGQTPNQYRATFYS
jgi:LacI family transcriptional regulator